MTPANAVSKFTTNWDGTNKGATFSGCWFPAMGWRDGNSGILAIVGSEGHYWQAVTYSAGFARQMYFNGSSLNLAHGYGSAHGFSVRPVAETD